jgi:20S proteasome alpha/beta subunit
LLSAIELQREQDFIQDSVPDLQDLLLTTVIGIKCKDGAVIGTDSQFTDRIYGIKSFGNKIYRINEFMILGGSGDPDQTNVLVKSLKENLKNKQYSDEELKKIIRKVLLRLHKEYNPDPTRQPSFYPLSLLAAKTDAGFGLYIIKLPYIYPVEQYRVIGSGSPLAEFLFKFSNRILERVGEKWSDRPVEKTEKTCAIMINEIKQSDGYSGGKTRVTSIGNNGVHELSDNDISNIPADSLDSFVKMAIEIGKHPDAFTELFKNSMPS